MIKNGLNVVVKVHKDENTIHDKSAKISETFRPQISLKKLKKRLPTSEPNPCDDINKPMSHSLIKISFL